MKVSPRAKKLLVILVIIVLIAEIVAAVFLYSVIQGVQVPEATVHIKIVNVTSSEITLGAAINVSNPNSFDVSLDGTTVSMVNENGTTILNFTVPNDNIPAHAQKTITSNETLAFTGPLTSVFTTTIHSTVGIHFFGIVNRQLPVTVHVITSGMEVISSIAVPEIRVNARLQTLVPTGIPFSGTIEVTNPDHLDFILGNMTVSVFTGDGQMLGQVIDVPGTVVAADKTTMIPFSGELGFTIFNIQQLRFLFQATAEAMVAGLHKTLPISAEAILPIPSLQVLLNSTVPVEISLLGSFRLRPSGVLVNITFEIRNPYVLDLFTDDIVVGVLRIDQNVSHLLGSVPLVPCLVSTNASVCRYGDITIPYRTLFFSGSHRLLPSLFELDLNGNFSLAGINQTLPLSFNAFLNPHLFRATQSRPP
jgi:hypothetical protein